MFRWFRGRQVLPTDGDETTVSILRERAVVMIRGNSKIDDGRWRIHQRRRRLLSRTTLAWLLGMLGTLRTLSPAPALGA
jgi:hypothetical protein